MLHKPMFVIRLLYLYAYISIIKKGLTNQWLINNNNKNNIKKKKKNIFDSAYVNNSHRQSTGVLYKTHSNIKYINITGPFCRILEALNLNTNKTDGLQSVKLKRNLINWNTKKLIKKH